MFKSKLIKILSFCITIIILFFSILPIFAYEKDVNGNSVESVEYQNTIAEDYANVSNVYAEIGSIYKVTIPKIVVLSGVTKQAQYYVKVEGDIAGYETICVIPDEIVDLYSNNKNMQIGTITQNKTAWTYSTLNTNANGLIKASDLTAGKWSGTFNFNISINKVLGDVVDPGHIDHIWKLVSSTPADCMTASTENYMCDCGVTKAEHETEAFGHNPGLAVEENKINATCTKNGSYDEVVYCTKCEEELSRTNKTIDAFGHNFINDECTNCYAKQITFIDNNVTVIQSPDDEKVQPPATYTNYLMMIQTHGIYCHDFKDSYWTNGDYLFTEEQRNYFEQSAKKELSLPNRGSSAGTYPANTGSYSISINATSEKADLNDYDVIFVVGIFNGHTYNNGYSQSGTAYVDLYNKSGLIKSFTHPIYLMNSGYYGNQAFGVIINLNELKEQGIDLSECYLNLRGNATSNGGYTCTVHYYYPIVCK